MSAQRPPAFRGVLLRLTDESDRIPGAVPARARNIIALQANRGPKRNRSGEGSRRL